MLAMLVMKALTSSWVGQLFWQGASAHLRHLQASLRLHTPSGEGVGGGEPKGLPEGPALAHRRVLDVRKVVREGLARLEGG